MNYYKNIFSLKGKLAYVIGGSGLIGKETINCLKTYKAKVINLDIKTLKGKYINEYFDITDDFNLEKKFLAIVKKHGIPDIFINCSYPRNKDWNKNTFTDITKNYLNLNIKNQLNSGVLTSVMVANLMKNKKKQGSIIFLGSIYGVVGQDLNIYEGTGMRENLSYSIIKGGLVNFTKQMASYYGKHNIRVNCICPGGIIDRVNSKNKKFLNNYSRKVPLKRLAKSKEISNAILFFSSKASSYITGHTMMVDGGWTCI